MTLRILLVSDNYPPFLGGAHRQTQLLARELHRRGHAVRVATVWHGGLPEVEDEFGVRVHRVKQLRTWRPWPLRDTRQRHQAPWPDPVTIWGLRRLINEFQPQVVHAYGWMAYSAAVALAGKNIPVLLSNRDYAASCASRTLVYRNQACGGPALAKCLDCAATLYGKPQGWLAVACVALGQRLLRRKVSGLHSVSSFVQAVTRRDFLDDWGTRPMPHAVIPSFHLAGEAAGRQRSGDVQAYVAQLPTTPFILFVGALRVVKGLNTLLAAYQQLRDAPPLVLIGTVEFDTPKTFPPGVVVLQDFPHRAVMAAWERCLFGVLPSLWAEPLGSVVYECMSQGKAVIGSRPGGHTDIIVEGETGILAPSGDVEALAAAMQRLIDDPAERERMGRAGRERARLFTADVSVPRFEALYRELAA